MNKNKSNKEIVQEMSLANSSTVENNEDTLKLCTVHNAKGAEFEYVFVIKMSEGNFPFQRAIEEGNIEEERRIAYVAFTRAKKGLYICGSTNFDDNYHDFPFAESRFIRDIKRLPEFTELELEFVVEEESFQNKGISSRLRKN